MATNEDAQQYKESVLAFVDSPAEIQVVQRMVSALKLWMAQALNMSC